MPNIIYKWSKTWAVQADHDSVKLGEIITVSSSNGDKDVRVTDIVTKTTKTGKTFDLLFTEDV